MVVNLFGSKLVNLLIMKHNLNLLGTFNKKIKK